MSGMVLSLCIPYVLSCWLPGMPTPKTCLKRFTCLYFYFIGAFSFENNWCVMVECTRNARVVYDETLNAYTAKCVCELIDKRPVYIYKTTRVC